MLLQMALFHSNGIVFFRAELLFHCIHVPYLLYLFICQWTLSLLPCLGWCMYLFELLFSPDICPGVGLQEYMAVLFLGFFFFFF